ncbi:MAG: o-succinylbenzoate synthase [Limnochordia bacterium]
MEIRKIELIHVQIPMAGPFRISSGTLYHRDSIIVKVYAGDLVGYGESAPMPGPFYSAETTETAWHILADFIAPIILQRKWNHPEEIFPALAGIRGNNFAKAGIETAFWDLYARKTNQSLAGLLGCQNKAVNSGVALGVFPTTEELVEQARAHLAEGYQRIKIKIQPGWDVEPVRALREALGDVPLFVDANSAYTLADLPIFQELDKYDLMMFEQPLTHDDLVDHAQLQSQVRTPVCLDESIHSLDAARQAIDLGSARIINIKIQRVGGIGPAKAIHDYCAQRGIPVWCGTMPESGLGQSQGLALAGLPNFRYPTDIEPSSRFFVEDIVNPPLIMSKEGTIPIPQGIGTGVEIRDDLIKAWTVKERTITAE